MEPLVAPGAPLPADRLVRYARQMVLPDVGDLGQRRLASARVLVVGAGGLGSPVLMYLAAAGVGTIGVIDGDVVEESNLHRQVVHGRSDLGRAKVDSAADRIADLDPDVTVRRHYRCIDARNSPEVLADYDLLVDGTDTFSTRYVVSDACARRGIPHVWGSIFRFDGQVSVFWAGHGPTYRDVFPVPPPPGSVPSCAEGGVLGALCGVIGAVMATEAIKLICGIGTPLVGRVLVCDALTMAWRTVRVRHDPDAPPLPPDDRASSGSGAERGSGADPGPGSACGAGDGADAAASISSAAAVPEAAAPADTVDAPTLRDLLATRSDVVLVDVREAWEREIVSIPGSAHLPLAVLESTLRTGGGSAALPPGRIVLYCRSGGRSARALDLVRRAGRADAVHLAGGVLAWIREVDPGLRTY